MARLRFQMTLKGLLALIAVVAAYLAGVVSNQALLESAWKELDATKRQLTLERETRELLDIGKELAAITASDDVSSERLGKLNKRLNAYSNKRPQSRADALRIMQWYKETGGNGPLSDDPR